MNGMDYTNDPRAILIHFNPNHDKLGRFAKSGSGSSKSSAKSVDKTKSGEYNKDSKFDKEKLKKYAKVSAGAVIATLAVIGGVYLVKSGKLDKIIKSGKDITKDAIDKIGDQTIDALNNVGLSGTSERIVGRQPEQIDMNMVSRINLAGTSKSPDRQFNCTHCTTAYILNSLFGRNVKALPFSGIDESSGIKTSYRDNNVFRSMFDNIEYQQFMTPALPAKISHNKPADFLSWNDALGRIKAGTGVLGVINKDGSGHALIYEKTKDGIISIIDPQHNYSFVATPALLERAWRPNLAIDFTNATIKPGADSLLSRFVE